MTMQTTKTETGFQLENIQVDAKPYSRLPTQQARTLLFVACGLPQKIIANNMGVKVSTVKQACSDLSFKFNTSTMRETVHMAMKQGVLRYSLCMMLCFLSALGGDLDRSFRTVRTNRITRTTRGARRLRNLQNSFLAC
jgi:DNA-binding CsgD family transcriptional regulator